MYADFKDGEYTEYYNQVVVDTGMEWQIWDIVRLPEYSFFEGSSTNISSNTG